MSLIFTEIIESEGKYWGVFSNSEQETKFPFDHNPSQTELDETIADYTLGQESLLLSGEDRIYNEGTLVRRDVFTEEGYIQGQCVGTREPYNEEHNSIYYLQPPSSELLSQWGVLDTHNLAYWYGIKTLNSGASFLKVVRYKAPWPNKPELLGRIWAYASVFSEDGTESDIKDLYINASPEYMQQWCADNSITYPLPVEETKTPWTYGVYWNSTTGAIQGVKGYVRYT